MDSQEVRTIAIGSTNRAKIRAVRQALARVWPEATYKDTQVPSGVSDMPMSDEEGAEGAIARAVGAREVEDADLGVGLEGSVTETPWGMLLTGWVAIVDRNGRRGLASGPRMPLPESVAQRLRKGEELAPLIDELSGSDGTRHKGGACGFLTGGLLPRDESFAVALVCALAPFIRPALYDGDQTTCTAHYPQDI